MHNILTLQNRPENILMLAAQRQLYMEAKRFFMIQVYITVPVTIVLSLLKLIPAEISGNFFVYTASFFGGAISIADLIIGHFIVSDYRSQAAKIREEFDCKVYEMEWDNISIRSKVDRETINKFGYKYRTIPDSPLENWYPEEIANQSREKAIYTCQKSNVHYDRSLRNKYVTTVCLVSMGIFLILFLISLTTDFSLRTFVFQVVIPSFPVLILTVKIITEHTKLIKASNELHKSMTALDQKESAINMQQLRVVQTQIYCNRKTGALVPDFFYNRERKKLEKEMHVNAANQ
jgi:hypothetical protein